MSRFAKNESPRLVEGETASLFDEMLSTAEDKVEKLESQQDVLKGQIEMLKETLKSKGMCGFQLHCRLYSICYLL